MNEKYITITGFNNYYGKRPFRIGGILLCEKQPENSFDSEAIACVKPYVGRVGYVANSPETVADGTMSAGRVYDKVDRKFYVRVLFATKTKVICCVMDDPADAEAELFEQEERIPEEPLEDDTASDFTELEF